MNMITIVLATLRIRVNLVACITLVAEDVYDNTC